MSAIWSVRGTGEAAHLDLGIDIKALDTVALDVTAWDEDGNRVELSIDRGEALTLFHALGDWLIATRIEPQSGNPADKAREVSSPETAAAVLAHLREHPTASVRSIGDALRIGQSTVHRAIKRLQGEGAVTVERLGTSNGYATRYVVASPMDPLR